VSAEPKLSAAAQANLPTHVAVIMDGNGRWAKQRGLPRVEGHRNGVESVRTIVRSAGELGIKYLTLYAFSVENWNRPKDEVDTLMKYLARFLKNEIGELNRNNVRLEAIGQIWRLPEAVQEQLAKTRAALAKNNGLTLILALSYGGRTELIEATRAIAEKVKSGALDPAEINERVVSEHLYTRHWPDPDLMIRTSGEMRISNFLLWQIAYAEIYVTDTYWPDFRRRHLLEAILAFQKRERRYGGVTPAAAGVS
jgi:undecaprenyl diphosphate synthase